MGSPLKILPLTSTWYWILFQNSNQFSMVKSVTTKTELIFLFHQDVNGSTKPFGKPVRICVLLQDWLANEWLFNGKQGGTESFQTPQSHQLQEQSIIMRFVPRNKIILAENCILIQDNVERIPILRTRLKINDTCLTSLIHTAQSSIDNKVLALKLNLIEKQNSLILDKRLRNRTD